jgi:5'-nucleotidase / UDP-sugar diphosphatase
MKSFRILLLLGLIAFVNPAGFSQKGSKSKVTEIIILHTNDMHAKIDNLGKLAYLADSLRRTHLYVYLVAAGDNFTGNPVVDKIPDKGYPMIDLMNRCRFAVSALGNHEFDLGQETLNKRVSEAKFPFICCNLDASGAVFKQPPPYFILEAGKDATIAFLGVIELNETGIPDTHPSKVKGIRFYDGIRKAEEFAWLKEKYHILIGLTHLGVDTDKELADSMPQLDMIIGGHSHTLLEKPLMENGVMIVQAGANLKYIGKTTLLVQNEKVISREDEVIPVSSLTKADTAIQRLIGKYNGNPGFSRVVGTAAEDITGSEELGSMMTDALTSMLHVDFAFQNLGGIRISSIPKGDITLKDIYRLDPFDNPVVIFNMKEAEIRSLICNAYKSQKQVDLMVSGMSYTIWSDSLLNCLKVEMKDKDGKALDPDREYSVAINSYVATSYRFDHRDPGTTATLTSAPALIQFLEKVRTVDYRGVRRADIVITK